MMIAGFGIFVLLLYIGGAIFVIGALIYLIIKRVEVKKREDFEKRNNWVIYSYKKQNNR